MSERSRAMVARAYLRSSGVPEPIINKTMPLPKRERVTFDVERGRWAFLFVRPLALLVIGVDLELRTAYISVAGQRRYSLQLWPSITLEVYE